MDPGTGLGAELTAGGHVIIFSLDETVIACVR